VALEELATNEGRSTYTVGRQGQKKNGQSGGNFNKNKSESKNGARQTLDRCLAWSQHLKGASDREGPHSGTSVGRRSGREMHRQARGVAGASLDKHRLPPPSTPPPVGGGQAYGMRNDPGHGLLLEVGQHHPSP